MEHTKIKHKMKDAWFKQVETEGGKSSKSLWSSVKTKKSGLEAVRHEGEIISDSTSVTSHIQAHFTNLATTIAIPHTNSCYAYHPSSRIRFHGHTAGGQTSHSKFTGWKSKGTGLHSQRADEKRGTTHGRGVNIDVPTFTAVFIYSSCMEY